MNYSILLTTSVAAPILALLAMLLWPTMPKRVAKGAALLASGYAMVSAAILWCAYYTQSLKGFAFTSYEFSTEKLPLPLFGLNGVSCIMFAMAAIVGFAAVLGTKTDMVKNYKSYMALIMAALCGLLGMFASMNMLFAYIFHEFAMVPTFLATVYWGSEGRRSAAMQMAIYLTLGALISLVGIVALFLFSGAQSFNIGDLISASTAQLANAKDASGLVFSLCVVGFGILISVFPFHSWAFKGYTAAPTAFSMMHAGVLKKFGFYMLLQLVIPALPWAANEYMGYVALAALFNVVLIGVLTMAQGDLKMMFSYSSVSHIGMCMLGLSTLSVLGVGAAALFAFGHGLSIALLFYISNIIINKAKTSDMDDMGGLISKAPVLCAFFLAAVLAGIGLPGFANFWGELGVFTALFGYNKIYCAIAALGLIISAIYGLRAVARVFFGPAKPQYDSVSDISTLEKLPAIVLLLALLFVGFFPKSVTTLLSSDLSQTSVFQQNIK